MPKVPLFGTFKNHRDRLIRSLLFLSPLFPCVPSSGREGVCSTSLFTSVGTPCRVPTLKISALFNFSVFKVRAEDGSRTRNLQLGRLELYQLSYFRFYTRRRNIGSKTVFFITNSQQVICETGHVGTGGFEPPKSKQQIYSLSHLATLVCPLHKKRAEEGTRTPDQLITNQLLYQLSYSGF